MAPFQAKIGSKRMTKRENKNCCYIPFLPDSKLKIPKQQQKNSKIPLRVHFKSKQVGKCRERERIKIIVLFRSYTALSRKLNKNSKKKFKKLKNTVMDSFQTK